MITRKEIRGVMSGVSRYEPPVLSLYMNINPAEPDHSPKALATRAKSTLDGMCVPPRVAEPVIDKIADGVPKGRTALIFADEKRVDLHLLLMELPLEDGTSGRVEARWGQPYVTPLLIAQDEDEHYGVVHVERDHIRLFEVSFSGAESLYTASRARRPSELDELPDARQGRLPYIPARSGANDQLAREHVRQLSRLFYLDTARQLRGRLQERELTRLILVGPREDVRRLERELSGRVEATIVLRLPSFPNHRHSESEVVKLLAQPLTQLRDQREEALLGRVAERGVAGLAPSIDALQQGRLSALVVTWPLDLQLYRDPESGYYFATRDGAAREPRALADALPELAAAYSTEIEFVLGKNRERLIQECGAICGLRRW